MVDTKEAVREACQNFLNSWNRHDWMAEHGEWADGEDYIEEGLLDPDDVADSAIDLDVGFNCQGWYCHEGWAAYRSGTALYLRWWRHPNTDLRHERDLWVRVEGEFFEETEEEGS